MEIVKGPDNDRVQTLTSMVQQYEVPLFRTCYMILRDRGLAEDAVQETFLKAYRALDTFRGECSEKTWLMRIAVNACRDMQRAQWLRFEDRRIQPELLPDPAQEYEGFNSLDLAQEVIRLPVRHREVVLLYFYHGMTMTETAAALGVSAATVHKRLNQALARLKHTLGRGYTHG